MNVLKISQKTIDAIYLAGQQSFKMNRVLDRCVSVLSVDFVCSQASEILHKRYAHFYPAPFADYGNEILDKWNEKIKYLVTPEDSYDYASITEMFQRILDENLVLYELLKQVMYTAFNEGDLNVFSHYETQMRTFNDLMSQSILMRDKAVQFEDNIPMFDFAFPSFFTFQA